MITMYERNTLQTVPGQTALGTRENLKIIYGFYFT